MDHQALALEMRGLREQVTGITDTAVAAADGLLIAADTANSIDPEGLAALAAAGLGLARRTAEASARGTLRRTVTYGSHGCAAFYAVGDTALMVVLGDEGMDVEHLHRATQPTLNRIGSILTDKATEKASEGV
ncbi:roadblock/LC7 domain-containing protein [Streptomyces griseorubiginosus]|uniref:roadblock/LC7 domain-containing protein n=1 Tax=Streptomyces griseorubiginosus TaxID=67304 RepID=UPI002E80E758|nr:roadblock/LC7 domain-containing protein [Streptomyces griseorubiginosus]WUB44597.1 roadblock/LC7 domain-containing protein [Streptomyces griseorubiginosus]WUB53114.1 roadblock/LC7 domain-containing protein [Streptomyces griseorubiginosus]